MVVLRGLSMFRCVIVLGLVFITLSSVSAQSSEVRIEESEIGQRLLVDGKPFMINGMNWDYFPRGTNYNYSLWDQPDELIQAALDEEMSLLRSMGVNAIRQYTGVPAKWISYIYKNYGIYTMLNHSFGRYGLTIDEVWMANTEYSDNRVRSQLLEEVTKMAQEYENTPGLLMYLLGNENNYGLFWAGAETEDFPDDETEKQVIGEKRGRPMYRLMNDAAKIIKANDGSHPVAICNGDLLFLDIVSEECQDVDVYGTNMYRGISFGDAFERVKNEYGKPIMFTEFGADAFNARTNSEDQYSQAYYNLGNWKEIYANAAGLGLSNNSIGGFTFQFSDGWWKYGQTKNLDVHDNNASWSNGGYDRDFEEGENNMNEEWFGICAKGATNTGGLYRLYPRAAYYALRTAHDFMPYKEGNTLVDLEAYFRNIDIMDAVISARGDKAALQGEQGKVLSISRLTAEFTTFHTGGDLISTPSNEIEGRNKYPDELGFDHMQSYYVGIEANPAPNLTADVQFNIIGNVAENPINEIFYENRGRPITVDGPNGQTDIIDNNRLSVYRANFNWKTKHADVTGFYRTGHYHWGYEGDFFGLYPEANYGPNIDVYNGEAPLGVEIEGKRQLEGLTLAMGPELWWGANPAILLKYSKKLGKYDVTGIFHEDLDQRGTTESSFAIPVPKTRRATLQIKRDFGKLGLQAGGIWGGQPLNGRIFQIAREEGSEYAVYQDEIQGKDNWGGKLKLTYSGGRFNWYVQAAAMGLVANGGADLTQTFTGWRLKETGSGNQYNFLSGFTYAIGKWQVAPNFLWQKPIEGPIPSDLPAPGRPRNILSDPFVVRANRETVAGEILLTYDPTPGTWMYAWDSDRIEDAPFAMSAGFVYRHLPTTQDAAIGILPDGRTTFAFAGAAPARDLWEVHTRMVSKISKNLGIIGNLYGGTAQANGSDDRTIHRYGMDVRMVYRKIKLTASAKFNDWGPFDYHRDFNQTYPQQFLLDISTSLSKPDWFNLPNTKIGVQGIFRTLDQYSPRYCPTHTMNAAGETICAPTVPGFDNGNEWEIRTYIHLNIFK